MQENVDAALDKASEVHEKLINLFGKEYVRRTADFAFKVLWPELANEHLKLLGELSDEHNILIKQSNKQILIIISVLHLDSLWRLNDEKFNLKAS